MKTNKSFMKRLKLTKNGKLVGRKPGQDHFNAKSSGTKNQSKKRSVLIHISNKSMSRFITK